MNLTKNTRVPSAIDVELSVPGHPEFDRAIRMPSDTTHRWAAEAFLLSIGSAVDRKALDDLAYEDHSFGSRTIDEPSAPRVDDRLWGWPAAREVTRQLTVPGFPHEVEYTFGSAPAPQIGDARFSVIGEGIRLPRTPQAGPWQTSTPAVPLDDVNHELLQRFSVVLPEANPIDALSPHRGIAANSRIATLLGSLTPERRLALLAHLDATGLLDDPDRDLSIVESATLPMRMLLDHVGRDGVAQDPETGWLPVGFDEGLAEALGWQASDAVAAPAEALISFARRARFIRRLKGRIVATNAAWSFVEPGPQSLERLADAVTAESTGYRSWHAKERDSPDVALVLLAIADGSLTDFADVAEVLRVGRPLIQERRWDGYDEWLSKPMWDESDADPGVTGRVQELLDGLAVLSATCAYGVIGSVTRAVAREALVMGCGWW